MGPLIMTCKTISETARTELIKGGWYEGRRIDTSAAIAALSQRGFSVFSLADAFLAEFGGLAYQIPTGGIRHVVFGTDVTLQWLPNEYIPALERVLNIRLCPVGFADGHIVILADTGMMILLNEEWMGCGCYPTICTGLEAILDPRGQPCDLIQLPPLP